MNASAPAQLPGNTVVTSAAAGTNAAPPPAIRDNPIAAPSSFRYLDNQLNKMDNDESGDTEDAPGGTGSPVSAIAKATTKIMKHIVVPGVASVGTASVGYMLLFGRTMYSAIAMLMGFGLGGQKLDPATLLDYWERDVSKRSAERDKNVERMFG